MQFGRVTTPMILPFIGTVITTECTSVMKPIETHGFKPMGNLTHDVGWEKMYTSRVLRMVQRDRNHACIVFWSLRNEAGRGRNLWKARKELLKMDASGPVCYEGGGAMVEGTGLTEVTDIICPMYPSVARTVGLTLLENESRPLILCGYSHAMGNLNGNLSWYWRYFWDDKHPRLQGGYIWDMIGKYLTLASRTNKFYWHNPDRTIRIAISKTSTGNIQLRFKNRYSFLDLSHLTWTWDLVSNWSIQVVAAGNFKISGKVDATEDAYINLDGAIGSI